MNHVNCFTFMSHEPHIAAQLTGPEREGVVQRMFSSIACRMVAEASPTHTIDVGAGTCDLPLMLTVGVEKIRTTACDEICGVVDGMLRLRVTAPPVDGKANARCIALLSKALGIPPSAVQLIRGESSRVKVLRIQGMSEQDVVKKLG